MEAHFVVSHYFFSSFAACFIEETFFIISSFINSKVIIFTH